MRLGNFFARLAAIMRTIVIGLGNPILTDDGVGVLVAEQVEKQLTEIERHRITVTEASVGGLRLMELMVGFQHVVLIDAIVSQNGSVPGTFKKFNLDDLRSITPTQHIASAHDTTLVTALDAGRMIGLDLPEDIMIFAIEVENVLDFSDIPTPAVAESVLPVTSAVLRELRSILKGEAI